ncbi:MAG: polysaccharide pyruvyl transferase family protein [Paludibacteraceae bacterium]|nr:polysaccharide pyruvyl transferase family protein [Paludibacteraceae bacterium]
MESNKKTVGIITMHKVQNFGSALQAFALQYIVGTLGFEGVLIDYKFPNKDHGASKKGMVQRIKESIGKKFNLTSGCVVLNKFASFYKKYFLLSARYLSIEDIQSKPPEFDIYVTGSDQVWNPKFIKEDTTFFLDFVTQRKKIAYAPSFGVSKLDESYISRIKPLLSQYQCLSCREISGSTLIREITENEVQVVLDPTLLLSSDQWNELMNIRKDTDEKFVFLYIQKYSFDPSKKIELLLKKIKEKLNVKVYSTCTLPSSCNGLFTYIDDAGPTDFLYYVRNASFIITASFHGTAFAVNYGKPFYSLILSKSASDDRQLSFLKLVGLEKRALLLDDIENIDFDFDDVCMNSQLLQLRKESLKYLREALV